MCCCLVCLVCYCLDVVFALIDDRWCYIVPCLLVGCVTALVSVSLAWLLLVVSFAGCCSALVSVCVDVVLPCSFAGTWCYLSFSLAVSCRCTINLIPTLIKSFIIKSVISQSLILYYSFSQSRVTTFKGWLTLSFLPLINLQIYEKVIFLITIIY